MHVQVVLQAFARLVYEVIHLTVTQENWMQVPGWALSSLGSGSLVGLNPTFVRYVRSTRAGDVVEMPEWFNGAVC